jgi:fructokinase
LLDKLLNGSNPQEAIDFACAVGALVATNKGANPDIKLNDINQFINPYSQ